VTSDAQARRLLALLVDEQAIETEPIAEVRADLAALGLDPARVTGSARRLATGASSPAVALLGRIAEAEESDDEIRRLEHADIAAVRQSLEEGATAATIANAQRAAGRDSKVVPLRRRRSRRMLYGLCGVAAALAASLVLIVGLSTRQFSRPARMEAPAEPTSIVASQPVTSETDSLQARMAPAGNGPAQSAEQVAADAERAITRLEAERAKVAGAVSEQSQLADAPRRAAEAEPTIVALLVVVNPISGPESVLLGKPPALFDARLPAGDLAQRIAEARSVAGERGVIALVSLRRPDGTVYDSVLVLRSERRALAVSSALSVGEPRPLRPLPQSLQQLLAPYASGYALIDLDQR